MVRPNAGTKGVPRVDREGQILEIASEQFGTNIRATATTTVPNFVRGSLVAVSALFQCLKPSQGILGSAAIVARMTIGLALRSRMGRRRSLGQALSYH